MSNRPRTTSECVWPEEGPSTTNSSCAVCLDVLHDEVLCQPCQHNFCRVCMHFVTQSDKLHKYTWSRAVPCPVCRQLILWTERQNGEQSNILMQLLSRLVPHRSSPDEVEKVTLTLPGRHINRYLPSSIVHGMEYWHSRRETIALVIACVVLLAVSVLIAAQVSTGIPTELQPSSDNTSHEMTRVIVSSLADLLIELAPTFIAVLSIGAVVCIVFAG